MPKIRFIKPDAYDMHESVLKAIKDSNKVPDGFGVGSRLDRMGRPSIPHVLVANILSGDIHMSNTRIQSIIDLLPPESISERLLEYHMKENGKPPMSRFSKMVTRDKRT